MADLALAREVAAILIVAATRALLPSSAGSP
jgi:hypothetical protein